MRIIAMLRTSGIFLSLLLLCACATEHVIGPRLPGDVVMNKDAGRANLLWVTLRLEKGEKLPFIVDTGTSHTLLDNSLEPQLGKRLGRHTTSRWGVKEESSIYAAPKLYLGNTPLMTDRNIIAYDLKRLSSNAGRPIMGILGMDCLGHYCIQLDFTAGKIRFLDDEHSNKQKWGKAFPLAALGVNDARPSVRGNLFGAKDSVSLVDTGYQHDGWLTPKSFQLWTNQAKLPADDEVHSPNGVMGGETYPDISLREERVKSDGIGLPFLARHLVTLDFPKQTMYLKRTSIGPLKDKEAAAKSAGKFPAP